MSCCSKNCKNQVRIIVLLGAPAAGKGTIAQHLLDNYSAVHFSTGNLLRNEIKNDSVIGREISSLVGTGCLVCDDIVNKVVESNLLKTVSIEDAFILLDGYPRTTEQAQFLDSIDSGKLKSLIRVVEIDVKHEAIVARISKRLVCEKCSSTFNTDELMVGGVVNKICSRCGGNLIKRADDNEEVIKKRLNEYEKMTLPLTKYYGERLVKISGDASIEKVMYTVDDALDGFGIQKRR